MKSDRRLTLLIQLTLFCMAMAYLESAVVVYLREIFYPSGFDFPMVRMPGRMAFTEIFREAATMVMLLSIAIIAGRDHLSRFALFLYCFAVWDIFYYVFLKVLIGWPASLLTWDILFLIPLVWTGPVITPVIVAITMILVALLILFNNHPVPLIRIHWMILLGAIFIFLSFIWDFSVYMLQQHSFAEMFQSRLNQKALELYVPVHFNWWLFIAGELLILASLTTQFLRAKNTIRS